LRPFLLGGCSLFLSNGPGDPTMCKETIAQLTKIVNDPNYKKPIFGICLGNQLLGLAAGTYSAPRSAVGMTVGRERRAQVELFGPCCVLFLSSP
jgi:anthranilate/para-aminobenzoate synthase component II